MKLGGALLATVIAASALAVVGIAGLVFAFDRLRELGTGYEIAVCFIVLWAIVFLTMTLLRMPATPIVASSGLALWILYRFAVAFLTAGWPLLLDLLAESVLAAGFCGYMTTGERPRTYYRGRLPRA